MKANLIAIALIALSLVVHVEIDETGPSEHRARKIVAARTV